MKISRWIYFPLIIILAYVLPHLLLNGSTLEITIWLIYGTIFGFGMLWWSNYKARQVNETDNPEIYETRQHRTLTVLLNYEKTFKVCRQAVDSLDPAKIRIENPADGIIKFRTRMNWNSFGHNVTVNLKKINNSLTEIEILTVPIPRTALISSGYSYKCVEDFCRFVREKDAEINQKVLTESAEILAEVYVKPFQKDRVDVKI